MMIADTRFISLTSDSWTSRNVDNFTAMTAHFIDDKWQYGNALLQTTYSDESHTAEYLSTFFQEVVDKWAVRQPVKITITTDNAANIVKGVDVAGYLGIG